MSLLTSHSRRVAVVALAALLLGPTVQLPAQDDDLVKAAVARANERLPDLQKKLSSGTDVQKRFRLDGFAVAGQRLKVIGVFLEPGFVAKDAEPARENADDPKKARPPFEVLQDELREIVKSAVKDVVKDKQILFDLSGVTRLEGKDQPYVVLQKAANDAGGTNQAADQIRLDGCQFDATGTLVLVGARGKGEATREWLAGAIEKNLAKNPAATSGGKLKVSTTEVKPVEWKLTPAELQKLFAASGNVGFERLRVDRVFLTHNADNPDPVDRWSMLRLTLTGAQLGEDPIDVDLLQATCRKHWEELFKGPTKVLIQAAPLLGPGNVEPVARLRKAIAARPALDGVRVDPGARFGSGGELLIAGIRPRVANGKQAEVIEKGVDECYHEVLADLVAIGDAAADRYKKLASGPGVSVANMSEADTRKVLADLRAWAEQTKDDVRFSRLYFGPDGGLKLLCEAPTDKDVEDVRAKLRELAPAYFQNVPKTPGSDAPPKKPKEEKTDPKEPPAVQVPTSPSITRIVAVRQPKGDVDPAPKAPPTPVIEATTIPAFTPFLRKQLADDPKKRWGAVLIERGYFDENNRYALRGIVDREVQKAEIAELIESFASDPTWKAYFTPPRPKGERMVLALDVIPMADLVARVQRVTPAYPVFDGVRVIGATYDKDANLVFTAHVVGRPNLNDCRLTLASLIARHPDYSRRLAKSQSPGNPRLLIEAVAPTPVAANDQLAEFSIGYGAAALARGDLPKAKEWIDLGLLHFPDDASIWFLSAYYNHLQGDKELTRRDLYRMIEIEGRLDFDGPIQRKRRYLAAKDLQGEKRSELEKIWLECWKEARDNPKPITLVQAK